MCPEDTGKEKDRETEATGKFHFTTPLALRLVNMKGGVWVQTPATSFSSSYLSLFPHLHRVAGQTWDAVCGHSSEHLLYSRHSVLDIDCTFHLKGSVRWKLFYHYFMMRSVSQRRWIICPRHIAEKCWGWGDECELVATILILTYELFESRHQNLDLVLLTMKYFRQREEV